MIVLDTNVLSEVLRPVVSPAVLAWFERQDPGTLWTTSVSAAEMLYGVYRMDDGRRRREIHAIITAVLFEDYDGRILPFDENAADAYAQLMARRRRTGRAIDMADAQIAAIATVHGAALATRNLRHFEDCGVDLIDPWAAG